MADDQRQVTAYIATSLSGSPKAGLEIYTAGAETACPADWTAEWEQSVFMDPALGNVGAPVVALIRNPERPLVTGSAIQGVST